MVRARDSMLRGQNGRKLEASDFTTRLTGADVQSVTFDGSQSTVGPAKVDRLLRGIKRHSLGRRGKHIEVLKMAMLKP